MIKRENPGWKNTDKSEHSKLENLLHNHKKWADRVSGQPGTIARDECQKYNLLHHTTFQRNTEKFPNRVLVFTRLRCHKTERKMLLADGRKRSFSAAHRGKMKIINYNSLFRYWVFSASTRIHPPLIVEYPSQCLEQRDLTRGALWQRLGTGTAGHP